ncbi:MAG: glycosyltransferase family 4 protein [Shinella sp.]|nr:glycosyltransferase family 4 protein [Shinella sp.]
MSHFAVQTVRPEQTGPLAVQVVRQYAPSRGGLEDVVANLSRELVKRGYRVRVVTLDQVFSARDEVLPASETIEGIEVVRIPFSGSTRYPLAPQVLRHVRDADLIHVHAIDFFFDALAWGRLLHGRPMIATTHGGFFHTRKYAAVKAIWFNTLTRLSARAYHSIVGCSEQDARVFRRIAGKRVREIVNGVDTGKFADAAAASATRSIVTIGRFSVNKRLERLLDAMQALIAREPGWRLHIVGVPGDLSVDDLARLISERGLSGNVYAHIGRSNAEIRTLLGTCSLFASASDYEGFGLVAIEAMSAGLMPLLNPNTAYSDLAARHGEIRLCDFDDPESAATAIAAAFRELEHDTPGYRQRAMIAAASYTWDRVAGRYAEIYRQVLDRPAAAIAVDEAGISVKQRAKT